MTKYIFFWGNQGAESLTVEAMTAGKPIFATNLIGISEIVSIEVGCMFDVILHPEDFTNKFTQLHQTKLEDKIALRDRNRPLAILHLVELENSKKLFEEVYSAK